MEQQSDINTIISNFVDSQPWIFWDTIYGVGGQRAPEEVLAFRYGILAVDPTVNVQKTSHDTNSYACSVEWGFGATRGMKIERIGVYFPLNVTDSLISRLLGSMRIEFWIAEKKFREARGDVSETRDQEKHVRVPDRDKEDKAGHGDFPMGCFDPAEYSDRTVSLRMDAYVPPILPYRFSIHMAHPVRLDFEGTRPIMVPIIEGQLERAVQ